jgi:hypothetical protein
MNTVFMYNMMLSSLNDPTNRQYYNFLVPSYYPIQNNVNYNQLYSYRLDLFGPSSAAIQLTSFYLVLQSPSNSDVAASLNVSNTRGLSSGQVLSSSSFLNGAIQIR